MKTDRHRIEISVIPIEAVHGAEADRIAARLQGDEALRARVMEIAKQERRGNLRPVEFEGPGIA